MKKEVKKSVLSRRYVELETDIYQRKRYKKGEIYKAIMGYIEILEEQLEFEEDSFAKARLEYEIRRAKKELKKYYEPSVLAIAKYELDGKEEIQKVRKKVQ